MDTRNKRAAALSVGLSFLLALPAPDGDIDTNDRKHLAYSYRLDVAIGESALGNATRLKPPRAGRVYAPDFTDFWRDLVFGLPLWEHEGPPHDIISGEPATTMQDGVTWELGEIGPRLRFDGMNTRLEWSVPDPFGAYQDASLLIMMTPARTGVTEQFLSIANASGQDEGLVLRNAALAGRLTYIHESGSVDQTRDFDDFYAAGERMCLIVTRHAGGAGGANFVKVYRNGLLVDTATTITNVDTGVARTIALGRRQTDQFSFNGTIECVWLARAIWEEALIYRLALDPWAPVRMYNDTYQSAAAAGVRVPWHLMVGWT